jgi:arylsulfatase A-like enzyme
MPLVRRERAEVNDAVFAEMTYHAAYEPQRAIRTRRWKYIRRFGDRRTPVLANIDDGPSKALLIDQGLAGRPVPREALHDLTFDPQEAHNVAADPARADVLADLRARLERWMRETDDPLLDGPVEPPPGAFLNSPDEVSASSEPSGALR